MAYNAVDESMMVAAMLHFSTCDNASDQKWTEPNIRLNGKWYHFDFVLAALDHAVTCPGAQSLNIRVNPFASNQEAAVLDTDPSDQPEPQPELPAALDLSTSDLEEVILLVDHYGSDVRYNLELVAEHIVLKQLPRHATESLASVRVVTNDYWKLDRGEEVQLYQLTGNGQYLVIGKYAYSYDEIKAFLARHGKELREYTAPAWAMQPEQGPQVQETAPGSGLTELPDSDAQSEDEPYEDEDDPTGSVAAPFINDSSPYWWYTLAQRWALMLTGCGTGVITLITLLTLLDQRTDFNPVLSVGIALIGSLNLTLGAGFLGSVAASRTVEDPRFARDEAHADQIIWVIGSIIGSAVLTLIDLMFLL